MWIRRGRLLGLIAGTALLAGACTLLDSGPTARFDVSPLVLYAGETVTFDASASTSSASIVSYSWEFASPAPASGRTVTATFPEPGRYTVRLTVEDARGRSDTTAEEVIVYLRSGTRLFNETFSDGEDALGRWALDPTWASEGESRIVSIGGSSGYALLVQSGRDRWHRRHAALTLPPLRIGQRIVIHVRAMTLQNQDGHTFLIAPARPAVGSPAGGFPSYLFTSDGGGSYVRETTAYGTDIARPIPFRPEIYRWHTYTFEYAHGSYQVLIDGEVYHSGPLDLPLPDGGDWRIVLGEESATEACRTYFDDILVSIEE